MPRISRLHTGQTRTATAHFRQHTRCLHGKKVVSTSTTRQILHTVSIFRRSFSTRRLVIVGWPALSRLLRRVAVLGRSAVQTATETSSTSYDGVGKHAPPAFSLIMSRSLPALMVSPERNQRDIIIRYANIALDWPDTEEVEKCACQMQYTITYLNYTETHLCVEAEEVPW